MIVLLLLASSLSYPPGQDCEAFRVGTFIYQFPEAGVVDDDRMQALRTETHQVTVDFVNDDITVARIEWTSECSYTLTILSSTSEREGISAVGNSILVDIEPLDEKRFKYNGRSSKAHLSGIEFSGVMKKISEPRE